MKYQKNIQPYILYLVANNTIIKDIEYIRIKLYILLWIKINS